MHKLAFTIGLVASLAVVPSLVWAADGDTYAVKAGDSMSRIAAHLGVSVSELQKANPGIKKPSDLKIGHKLHVPPKAGAAAPTPAPVADPTPAPAPPPPEAAPAPAPVAEPAPAPAPPPPEVAPAPAPAPTPVAEPAPAPAPAPVVEPAPAPQPALVAAAPAPAPAGGLTTSKAATTADEGSRTTGYVLVGAGAVLVVAAAVLCGIAVSQANQAGTAVGTAQPGQSSTLDTSHTLNAEQFGIGAGVSLLGGIGLGMLGANMLMSDAPSK